MREDQFEGYVAEVLALREEFRGRIEVRLGLEADYAEEGTDRLYDEYYRLLAKAARSGHFDVLTHFDLPKKFGNRPAARAKPRRGRRSPRRGRADAPWRSHPQASESRSARRTRKSAFCGGSSPRESP